MQASHQYTQGDLQQNAQGVHPQELAVLGSQQREHDAQEQGGGRERLKAHHAVYVVAVAALDLVAHVLQSKERRCHAGWVHCPFEVTSTSEICHCSNGCHELPCTASECMQGSTPQMLLQSHFALFLLRRSRAFCCDNEQINCSIHAIRVQQVHNVVVLQRSTPQVYL